MKMQAIKNVLQKIIDHPYAAPVIDPIAALDNRFWGKVKKSIAVDGYGIYKMQRAGGKSRFRAVADGWKNMLLFATGHDRNDGNMIVLACAGTCGALGAAIGLSTLPALSLGGAGIIAALNMAAFVTAGATGFAIGTVTGAVIAPIFMNTLLSLHTSLTLTISGGGVGLIGGIAKAASYAKDPRKYTLLQRMRAVRNAEKENTVRTSAEDAPIGPREIIGNIDLRSEMNQQELLEKIDARFSREFDEARKMKFDAAASRGTGADVTAPVIPNMKKKPFNPGRPPSWKS